MKVYGNAAPSSYFCKPKIIKAKKGRYAGNRACGLQSGSSVSWLFHSGHETRFSEPQLPYLEDKANNSAFLVGWL